jgi:hypothetical protein
MANPSVKQNCPPFIQKEEQGLVSWLVGWLVSLLSSQPTNQPNLFCSAQVEPGGLLAQLLERGHAMIDGDWPALLVEPDGRGHGQDAKKAGEGVMGDGIKRMNGGSGCGRQLGQDRLLLEVALGTICRCKIEQRRAGRQNAGYLIGHSLPHHLLDAPSLHCAPGITSQDADSKSKCYKDKTFKNHWAASLLL